MNLQDELNVWEKLKDKDFVVNNENLMGLCNYAIQELKAKINLENLNNSFDKMGEK